MKNPLAIAFKGKGLANVMRRGASIAGRYGLTTGKLADQLRQLATLTQGFGSRATLPITTVVLNRNPGVIRELQAAGVEFAIHGYHHVDHSQLSLAAQLQRLTLAQRVFADNGIHLRGFRGPYLRFNAETLQVLAQLGLAYDASPAIAWEVVTAPPPAYERALAFYRAQTAAQRLSVPWREAGLVRIPYSLPDDESLVERLGLEGPAPMAALWLAILRRTHALGELFTVGLHPERTTLLLEPWRAVLAEARTLRPGVWLARLDEIAAWWLARAAARVTLTAGPDGAFHIAVAGPAGTTLLARGVGGLGEAAPWADGYHRLTSTQVTVTAPARPWIGLSPRTPAAVADFLCEQGYLIERDAAARAAYTVYVDRPALAADEQRAFLTEIEAAAAPLVRLGRWPDGARSALAVTGDIDALTLWDYGLRFIER